MSAIFLDAFFTDNIQNPNFFNGRVLTATDLRDLQAVNRERARRLGQAIGPGVAYGLAVTGAGNSLTIGAGLAINLQGDALRLPGNVTVQLVGIEPALASVDSPFAPCDELGTVTITGSVSAEFSLLAITGATRYSNDLAPYDSLNGARGSGCALRRYEEEGVQFKLVPLSRADFSPAPTTQASLQQSQWAALGLGIPALLAANPDPRRLPAATGLAEVLRNRTPASLNPCDVPLALLRYADGAVRWVDMWSVRRPCDGDLRPLAAPSIEAGSPVERFTRYTGRRRQIELHAFLLQFQNQLEQLRRSVSNPRTLRAADHFAYLPPIGVLQTTSSRVNTGLRFNPETFFGRTLPRLTLAPAYLPELFAQALLIEPIAVGASMPLVLYEVSGSDPDDPYVIFARGEQAVEVTDSAPAEPEPPPDEPDRSPPQPGVLVIGVFDEAGNLLSQKDVERVSAHDLRRGVSYTAQPFVAGGTSGSRVGGTRSGNNLIYLLYEKSSATAEKYRRSGPSFADFAVERDAAVYRFANLPAGTYTVKAAPRTGVRRHSNSDTFTVRAQQTVNGAIVLPAQDVIRPPEIYTIEPPIVLENGYIFEKYMIQPEWKDLIDPIDPPPDDWWRLDEPDIQVAFEKGLRPFVEADPAIAGTGPVIYVDHSYNPAQPAGDLYAVLETRDGSRHPVVLVGGDIALDEPVAASRSGIRDIDAATYNTQLAPNGMGDLAVLAAAPASLVAGVLGRDSASAQSLVSEVRDKVTTQFQGGFSQYPGIDATIDAALRETFGDRVALANASVDQVLAVLNPAGAPAQYSDAFGTRFLNWARGSVPSESWSLSGIGSLSGPNRDALAGISITTRENLLDHSRSEAGRNELLELLNMSDSELQNLLGTAAAGFVAGQIATSRRAGVGQVEGVSRGQARALVNAGITSAAQLANSDPNEIAAQLNLPPEEAQAIVSSARARSPGFTSIVTLLGGDEAAATNLAAAGIGSIGDIARVGNTALSGALGGNTSLAGAISVAAGRVTAGGFGPPVIGAFGRRRP